MKKIFVAMTLALSLASFAYADEPAKAPAAPGAPTATAPAAPGAPTAVTSPAVTPAPQAAAPLAPPPPKQIKADRGITITMFVIIIAVTLCIVVWAAKRTKTAADFYAAGGGITGTQNGWAIAGDYMSAASFLGISGLISLYGLDGFLYSVGWLVAYITVLLLIAEPCRNAGK